MKDLSCIPKNSVNFIFIDPPYNIKRYQTSKMIVEGREDINKELPKWDEYEIDPDYLSFMFKNILTSNGNVAVFCSYNLLGKWVDAFNKYFDVCQVSVWVKPNPTPQFRKVSFLNATEFIVWGWNKGHTWNFTTQAEMHNVAKFPICAGKERVKGSDGKNLHPTQKPVRLLEKYIRLASNKGDIVADYFMGTGSAGVASINLNRDFIGYEINREYYKYAQRRINGTYSLRSYKNMAVF